MPDQRPEPNPHTTRPDIGSLWAMQAAVHDALPLMDHTPQLRWRINHADWQHLARVFLNGQPVARIEVDGTRTLFGTPVDLINPDPGTWPALVITNDRRN